MNNKIDNGFIFLSLRLNVNLFRVISCLFFSCLFVVFFLVFQNKDRPPNYTKAKPLKYTKKPVVFHGCFKYVGSAQRREIIAMCS